MQLLLANHAIAEAETVLVRKLGGIAVAALITGVKKQKKEACAHGFVL